MRRTLALVCLLGVTACDQTLTNQTESTFLYRGEQLRAVTYTVQRNGQPVQLRNINVRPFSITCSPTDDAQCTAKIRSELNTRRKF
ncbi:MAG: hypothetical protein AAFQ59_03185 [Pseudomonadota bacterium]